MSGIAQLIYDNPLVVVNFLIDVDRARCRNTIFSHVADSSRSLVYSFEIKLITRQSHHLSCQQHDTFSLFNKRIM